MISTPKSIILHGTGRSGTTLLNNILSNHPDLAWISNYQVKALNFQWLSYLNRFIKKSVDLNKTDRNRWLIHASNEPYALWKKFYPNFNNENEWPNGKKNDLERYISGVISKSGKKAFLTKITGFSRARFIEHGLSDYVILWIDRDPIAVVSSMMKQKWFYKKNHVGFDELDSLEKIELYCNFFSRVSDSRHELNQNKIFYVKYEDLIDNPSLFIMEILEKLGLSSNKRFLKIVEDWKISSVSINDYKKQYSPDEWEMLNRSLKKYLDEYYG